MNVKIVLVNKLKRLIMINMLIDIQIVNLQLNRSGLQTQASK